MGIVRFGTKRVVVGAVVLAVIPWTIFIGALAAVVSDAAWGLLVGIVAGPLIVLFYPERAVAERVYASLIAKSGRGADDRLHNIADGLALAIGVPAQGVAIIDSAIPNVLALPTKSQGLVVVATEGAMRLLNRRELESLVASQIVVAGERWVRIATRAQLAQAPWAFLLAATFPLGLLSSPTYFILAFGCVFIFVITSLYRRADAARDLVADGVAINTTKNPDALVSALRNLRPAVLVAPEQKLGSIGMKVDPFAVLSVRSKTSTTMTVNGRSRSWSTEDELATELGFRADRMERVARGEFAALGGLGPFRKAWSLLGKPENPYQLTETERAAALAAKAPTQSKPFR